MSRQNCRYFFCRYFSYNKTNHLARDMRSYACAYIYSEHSSDILKKSSLQAHTIFTDLLLLCCSLWRGPQRVCAAAHSLLLPPHRRHAAFVPLLCCQSGPGEYTVEVFNFYILILWWKHNIRSRQRSQIFNTFKQIVCTLKLWLLVSKDHYIPSVMVFKYISISGIEKVYTSIFPNIHNSPKVGK